MFCQRCGTKNSEGAAFCSDCGAPLQAQAAAAFCQQCGAPGRAGQRFCEGCGAPLAIPGTPANVTTPVYTPPAEPAQAATVPQRRGNAGRTIAVIVAALVVASIVSQGIAASLIRLALRLSGSGGYVHAYATYGVLRLIVYAVIVGLALKLFGR
jgi:hypothetical protein